MKKIIFIMIIGISAVSKYQKAEGQNNGNPVAVGMIKSFMDKPDLRKLAIEAGYAGIFPLDKFVTPKGVDGGIMLWYCYDSGKNEFFLALEYLNKYDPANLPTAPLSPMLLRSVPIPYPKNDSTDETTLNDHIQNDETTSLKGKPFITISRADATKYVQEFKANLGAYNDYAFACFTESKTPNQGISDQYIKNFHDLTLKNKGQFVRYYFGFQEKDDHGKSMVNKIRVILVAIDDKGKKIKPETKKTTPPDPLDAGVLDYSFPPPPYNK